MIYITEFTESNLTHASATKHVIKLKFNYITGYVHKLWVIARSDTDATLNPRNNPFTKGIGSIYSLRSYSLRVCAPYHQYDTIQHLFNVFRPHLDRYGTHNHRIDVLIHEYYQMLLNCTIWPTMRMRMRIIVWQK